MVWFILSFHSFVTLNTINQCHWTPVFSVSLHLRSHNICFSAVRAYRSGFYRYLHRHRMIAFFSDQNTIRFCFRQGSPSHFLIVCFVAMDLLGLLDPNFLLVFSLDNILSSR